LQKSANLMTHLTSCTDCSTQLNNLGPLHVVSYRLILDNFIIYFQTRRTVWAVSN
jgi:hypothetical protein